ncbi:hypothetical protein H6P81_001781 [Aristolochia fimbriata]|uniref:HMA domain-containing protein n=1 Tax=Aristolochia fimbriata TaxID=158543 RepID=A0AAV7F8J0_ARIFI|nr:hypothetical protein H6P81_001781 [Aristolochia fimbriata]
MPIAEKQKVTVSGNVDSATLIKKLVRAGKHAELWSQKSNQNQKHQPANCIKDDKSAKDQKQANAKKAVQINQNQNKGGPVNGSAGKVGGAGNPNQNVALKNPNGIEHKNGNIGGGNKMNAGLHMGGNLNPNLGEAKKLTELNMNPMGLGLHGHGGGMGGLTGNLGGFQVQQPSSFQANGLAGNGFGGFHQPSPGLTNLQAYQDFPSSMGMNMHIRPDSKTCGSLAVTRCRGLTKTGVYRMPWNGYRKVGVQSRSLPSSIDDLAVSFSIFIEKPI